MQPTADAATSGTPDQHRPREAVALDTAPVVAEVVRSGFVESVHRGLVAGIDASGAVAIRLGDIEAPVFPRSSNKPLQAIAMLRAGLDLDGELLALAAASHSGESFHVEGARRLLAGAGLAESALQCPPDLPLDDDARDAVIRAGGTKARVYMNCSGKHSAMLATCVANGWPIDSYRDPEHPLQVAIRDTVEEFADEPVAAIGVDGCGAPVMAVSPLGLARAFRRVGLAAVGTPEHRVAEAFRRFPEWTCGTTREEAAVMRALPGAVNKAGADAVDAIVTADGTTVVVKIADGYQRARLPVAAAALRQLGVPTDQLDTIANLTAPPVFGAGEPVGAIRVAGDLAAG